MVVGLFSSLKSPGFGWFLRNGGIGRIRVPID